MKLYSSNDSYKLYHGNMLDMLEVIESNTIDSIVTDPPYELNFMGKGWDNSGIAFQKETWEKCYDVLKPGGYLLAFGGSRTFHRIACAIEDAGFEIRDTICYMYGSGFPKSMNLSKQFEKKNDKENALKWKNWGTALKPSYESIIVARKPFKGSLVDNIIQYGVGGINIDECRVETNEELRRTSGGFYSKSDIFQNDEKYKINTFETRDKLEGRFPANTILTYDETDFDEVCGGFPDTNPSKQVIGGANRKSQTQEGRTSAGGWKETNRIRKTEGYNDNGGSASRYFYCAKASKRDRDEGLEEFEEKENTITYGDGFNSSTKLATQQQIETGQVGNRSLRKNIHPTVKPTELMQYLVRLVTPNNGTILDPFNGSGSTGKAVMYENKERGKNYKYIGIELTEEYLPISKARIEYVCNMQRQEIKEKQMTIFDLVKDSD